MKEPIKILLINQQLTLVNIKQFYISRQKNSQKVRKTSPTLQEHDYLSMYGLRQPQRSRERAAEKLANTNLWCLAYQEIYRCLRE